jgi:hypothetical protein
VAPLEPCGAAALDESEQRPTRDACRSAAAPFRERRLRASPELAPELDERSRAALARQRVPQLVHLDCERPAERGAAGRLPSSMKQQSRPAISLLVLKRRSRWSAAAPCWRMIVFSSRSSWAARRRVARVPPTWVRSIRVRLPGARRPSHPRPCGGSPGRTWTVAVDMAGRRGALSPSTACAWDRG